MIRMLQRWAGGVSRPAARALALVLAAILPLVGGCTLSNMPGFGDRTPAKPEYSGLAHHSVAIVVLADDSTLYEYPDIPLNVSQAVASALTVAVPGVKVTDPRALTKFERDNPYWETLPPSDLIRRLKVQRLMLIDLTHFSTHEPGNANVWMGVMVANVSIGEAESANPDNFVYRTNVSAQYPGDRSLGVLDSDEQTVRLALLQTFTHNLLARFVASSR